MSLLFTGQPQNSQLVVGGADVSTGNPVPVAIQGTTTSAGPVRTDVTGAALEAGHVLKASAGTFISMACEIDPTAPTATYDLLLLDAASVPADGAVTVLASVAVDHVNGTRDYLQLTADQGGIAGATGLVVVLSTTRPSKTAAGSYLWLETASVS